MVQMRASKSLQYIYLFIVLYKSYSKYKKRIQQLNKNKHPKITNKKCST